MSDLAERVLCRSCGLERRGAGGVFRQRNMGRRAASRMGVMAGASSGMDLSRYDVVGEPH